MTKRPIGIAGAGRLAQALGKLLYDANLPVVAVASRTSDRAVQAAEFIGSGVRPVSFSELPAWCPRVIIAVSDDAISSVADLLCASGFADGIVVHTSGLYGADVLACLAAQGASCAALHPLQTVPDPQTGVKDLPDSVWAVSGEGEALEWSRELVEVLQGRVMSVPDASRGLYHTAAVFASNYVVVLLEAALGLLREAGIDPKEAADAFAKLAHTGIDNVLADGKRSLTGPLTRGDVGTIRKHLESLGERRLLDVLLLYRAVAVHGVRLARRQGLDESKATALEALLSGRK